jgi:hypothetical protein
VSDRESLGEISGKLDQVLERLDEMEKTVVSIEGTLKVDIDLATKPLGETHVGVGDSVNYPLHDMLRGGPFFGTVAWVGVDSDGTVNAGVQVEGSDEGPIEVPASALTRVVA